MNRPHAYQLLTAELSTYRQLGYRELASMIGKRAERSTTGEDGVRYSLEISVNWRAEAEEEIVVSVVIAPADWGAPHDRLEESLLVSG